MWTIANIPVYNKVHDDKLDIIFSVHSYSALSGFEDD